MQLNSYLYLGGQCEAVFQFYQQRLGGKIEAMILRMLNCEGDVSGTQGSKR